MGILDRIMNFFAAVLSAITRPFRRTPSPAIDREVNKAIELVENDVRQILAVYPLSRLAEDLRDFAAISTELIHLLSYLIRLAEEFEHKSGKDKKDFVIATALALYDKHRINLPGVPQPFEKLLLQLFLPVMIDYTVQFFNVNFGQEWAKVSRGAEDIRAGMSSHRVQPQVQPQPLDIVRLL
jgi:hypothetical protein